MTKTPTKYPKHQPSNKGVKDATVTVYKSGHSKVVTIPAWFPVEIGDTLKAQKQKSKLIFKPISQDIDKQTQKDLKKIQQLSGKSPGLTKGLETIEKLEEFLEGIYD